MDPRERMHDSLEESIRIAVDRHLSTVWTAMPVRVMEDSDGHRCKLQIRVRGSSQDTQGQMQPQDIAELGKVVIHYPSGGKLTATHPIKADDEGMAVFQSRCIDGWTENGGQQDEPYRRRHELSDVIYVPGVRNKPRQLDPSPSTNSYQIRTNDGKQYIELTEDGVCHIYATEVHVHAPKIFMDGNQKGDKENGSLKENEGETAVEVKGTIHATRDISTDQSVRAKENVEAQQTVTGHQEVIGRNIHLTSHRHSGVQGGQSVTGPPQG